MDNDKISSFKSHFLTFISQAITGVLFPFYEDITENGTFDTNSIDYCLNQFHDLNIVPLLYIDYINECWDKYKTKKNEDEYDYVIMKLDKIKKAGNIKHNYCLFDLIWNFSFKALIIILSRIDEKMIEDYENFKISIKNLLDIFLEFSKEELIDYVEQCEFENYDIDEKIKNDMFNRDKFIDVKYIMSVC